MMARKRLILTEEAIRAIKTLKRLESTYHSVVINRIDDYLSIYHKISDAQLISFSYD
jgi:hypothetical protein